MIKIGTQQKLSNSIALTPQLQHAIRILQLSQMELAQEIQTALDNNPLLETDTDDTIQLEKTIDSYDSHHNDAHGEEDIQFAETNLSDLHQNNFLNDDLAIDAQWQDIYSHAPTYEAAQYNFDTDTYSNDELNLHEHVKQQMQMFTLNNTEEFISATLINDLDTNGFLHTSITDIATHINEQLATLAHEQALAITNEDVMVVLKLIQHCEPVGIGATCLSHSLQLQLDHLHKQHPHYHYASKILAHHTVLIKNDIRKLVKNTKLNSADIEQGIALIRTLQPNPAKKFDNKQYNYQIPDVIVRKKNNRWFVELNQDNVPKLRINQTYANMVVTTTDKSTKSYIQSHTQQAKQFISSIAERNTNLLAVTYAVVQKQQAFFEHGIQHMQPLILQDIADMVGLHQSTVSRITTNKYCLTNHGLFELKKFFSSSVGDENNSNASSAIIAKIKQLISQEDSKKPLSDSAITKLLAQQNITVARRTVAKYRESLGISSSSQRKQLF